MQKFLSTAAPLATLILFVSVAAPSTATLVILGVYGLLFIYLAPGAMLVYQRRRWKVSFRGQPLPRGLRLMTIGYPLLVTLVIGLSIASPQEGEWSAEEFTTFGLPQVVGIFGGGATLLLAAAIAARRRRGAFRECPYCLARIRREATRCRYCTSEVEPALVNARVIEQGQSRETGTISRWQPPRYAEPGRKKKDFGQLSVPRVGSSATSIRLTPSQAVANPRQERSPRSN
jgi:hypothetical protein